MDTLGELWDKVTILDIRIEKHPDAKARLELAHQRDLLAKEFDEVLENGGVGRAVPKYKLRATKTQDFQDHSIDDLKRELFRVNAEAWDNEDGRDRAMRFAEDVVPDAAMYFGQLQDLLNLDRREQRLNQTRSAIIDAINRRGAEQWGRK